MDFKQWKILDSEIKKLMHKNGLTPEMILEHVEGELNELAIKTPYGWETVFYGNGEACIYVDVNGEDYYFSYVVDDYGNGPFIINF